MVFGLEIFQEGDEAMLGVIRGYLGEHHRFVPKAVAQHLVHFPMKVEIFLQHLQELITGKLPDRRRFKSRRTARVGEAGDEGRFAKAFAWSKDSLDELLTVGTDDKHFHRASFHLIVI